MPRTIVSFPRDATLTALPSLASVLLIAIAMAVGADGPGGVPAAEGGEGCVVLLAAEGALAGGEAARDAIRAAGGRPLHLFPPDAAIAWLPDGAEAALAARWPALAVFAEGAAPEPPTALAPAARAAAAFWRARCANAAGAGGAAAAAAAAAAKAAPDLPAGDALVRPPTAGADAASKDAAAQSSAAAPEGATFWDLSEFMLGDVSVNIVLVESDGAIDPDTETWTAAMEANVQAEVPLAFDWWLARAGSYPLSFTYQFATAKTGYEPITHPQSDEGLWIAEAMSNLGYSTGDYFTRVAAYDNDTRDADGTHWAVTVFVANSLADADGKFSNGYFAYSYLGGPFLVMTYDNNGWGIGNMDAVLAHELAHSFYALDEYASAAIPCAQQSGYLAAQNGNSLVAGCPAADPTCIMRSVVLASASLETYTKGQIGWTDTDADGLPNVIDTAPLAALDPYVPSGDPYRPALTGTAIDVPLGNANPMGYGTDLTINTVTGVEWRVDGGAWTALAPSDGAWDETSEAFALQSETLYPGLHVFEVRATNSVGNAQAVASAETILVSASTAVGGAGAGVTRLGVAIPNPTRSAARIEWSLAAPGDVALAVYDASGRRVRSLARGAFPAGAHSALWDGRDDAGAAAPSGVYLYRLDAAGFSGVERVTLLR
jgi:hypothetical protein